ncbi:MAG: phosphoribosylamine--glycine ligase [Myxococcales bacterium]|nr:phosphoribosylamine--glycine ligase [Myxococcales bacterium]
MRVAVVGSGGREHALAWKISSSELVREVLCFPGNPGTAGEPGVTNVSLVPSLGLAEQILKSQPDLVVIGPEAPLVDGVADSLRNAGVPVVGPNKLGAELEGSKAFAKRVMEKAGVPTARHATVRTFEEARSAIEDFEVPPVIKADGLAAGKGVVVPETRQEALDAAHQMLVEGRFASAGDTLVIEERLFGIEASLIVLTDGTSAVPLTSSQDHKRLRDGDSGPNTGGMGAFAPSAHLDGAAMSRAVDDIVLPVLSALRNLGVPYCGFLFAGLMLTADGPRVLEFNVRSGDPETQAIVFGLEGDLVPLLLGAANGTLGEATPLSSRPTTTIVLAARGYPEAPEKDVVISGLEEAQLDDQVKVFHAGTAVKNGQLVTNGGRVLNVTASGATMEEARKRAYAGASKIRFDGVQYRRDIGSTG